MTKEIDYANLPHFHMIEGLTNALMAKTGQTEPHFFRILGAYFFSLIAANMRVSVSTKDRGLFPVNLFAISLASSGHGKGHSVSILSETVMEPFMNTFMKSTMPLVIDGRLQDLAVKRARANGETTPEEELVNVQRDFASTGPYLPVFDSGTSPAFKQLRTQLLMSTIGCLNMRTDELGSNLSGIEEILGAFIEAFDVGVINPKLVKHTKDQQRLAVDTGRTPAMWLGFGTPVRVLDGGKTESDFMSHLETGFARRCFFGYCTDDTHAVDMTPDQIYDVRVNPKSAAYLDSLGTQLEACADVSNHNAKIIMSREMSIKLIAYEMRNQALAKELPEQQIIQQTELLHRHAKVLKLAGAFAFVNGDTEITEETLNAAIRMGEDSGKHFHNMLQRDPAHIRLCKYIGSMGTAMTQADLIQNLPYYKGTEGARRDMMTLAAAWGMRNNIAISRRFTAGVEEIQGAMLKDTDLDSVTFSYSKDLSQNYRASNADFFKLHKLITLPDYHWVTHSFKQGHRHSDDVIPGFNLLVLDVDDGLSIKTAKMLLKDYTYCIHTTKSHGKIHDGAGVQVDKYRVIIPLSHTLKLSVSDYTLFMESVFDVLPFAVDTATKDIARKWATHKGDYWYNTGKLWDVLPHIPATKRADDHNEAISQLFSLSHIERWFCSNTASGNRSNNLFRFGAMLVDAGNTIDLVKKAVTDLNDKLPQPLEQKELDNTVFRSLHRRVIDKQGDDS